MITVMDDFGRYHGSDLALMAAAYPDPPPGLTIKRFSAAIRELETGDLFRRYEVGGRTYIYSPTWAQYQRLRAQDSKFPHPSIESLQVQQNQGGGHRAAECPPLDSAARPESETESESETDNNTRSSSAPGCPGPTATKSKSNGFDAFWMAYPRKKSKGRAARAWAKLRPDGALLERILEAVRAQARSRDWCKDGGRFIPHPATWLNAMGWEDCIEAANDDELPPLRM